MKTQIKGVILLALLLAAMAVVPCVSAAECRGVGSPAAGDVMIASPGESANLFDEFGLQRPAKPADEMKLIPYTESRKVADRILAAMDMPEASGAVIGVYDLGSSHIMLISQDDEILEAVYDGENVATYTIAPLLLGEMKQSGTVEKSETGITAGDGKTIRRESSTRLYSVTLQVPGKATALTTYIVKKSRTDVYRNGLVDIASLHTQGWFYVDYGISITAIGDYSSYWVTSLPFWQGCEYNTQNLGIGTTLGQHKTHLKFGAPYVRHTMDMWVSCDAWLNANDGGYTNSWSSVNNDACS
jgi:hypothetical protein